MPPDDPPRPSEPPLDEHLGAVHAGWVTPPGVITAIIGELGAAEVTDIRRIVTGEQNEVYDVTRDGAAPLIVRISHRGHAAHDREVWVLRQCAARGIRAPRIHDHRVIDVAGEQRSIIVMEKVPGQSLREADLTDVDVRGVLEELGAWLSELHAIPVDGLGYLDGSGVGELATLDEWLAGVADGAAAFEAAGRSVGLEPDTIRAWVHEIDEALRATPPRITLIHNDLQAVHVMVHDGRLSGIIDFGEVAAEPAASDFAKWDFSDGDRFPVAWLRAGYGEPDLLAPPHERTYRALWVATGLWRMSWYHQTGFRPGIEAARDRLLQTP